MQSTMFDRFRKAIPKPVKRLAVPVLAMFGGKYRSEINYWRRCHQREGTFHNKHFRPMMLAIAEEADETFLQGKVVADFGCGPRGSLAWLTGATTIGIDVLAPLYARSFPDDLRAHGMMYVASTESLIPIPAKSVDVMFTINALDHVANLDVICSELIRVMRPGAQLIASFNLNEKATAAEPQTLTEDVLQRVLLRSFEPHSTRFGCHREGDDVYGEMFDGRSTYVTGKPGYMWYRGSLRR